MYMNLQREKTDEKQFSILINICTYFLFQLRKIFVFGRFCSKHFLYHFSIRMLLVVIVNVVCQRLSSE